MRSQHAANDSLPLVKAIEVDLERAAHMGLVVRVTVELHTVNLDGAVVAGSAPGAAPAGRLVSPETMHRGMGRCCGDGDG